MDAQNTFGICSLEYVEFVDYYFLDMESINDFSDVDSMADYYIADMKSISYFSMWIPQLIITLQTWIF